MLNQEIIEKLGRMFKITAFSITLIGLSLSEINFSSLDLGL